jgi:hypothetical protein
MKLTLKWIDDLLAEADFRAMNIPFSVKEIRFSQIDLYESCQNGARLGDQVVAELVSDYAQAMRNGAPFLRMAAYLGKAGYVLTSGVQRSCSFKELIDAGDISGDPLIEIYALQTSDKMLIEGITRSANVPHGGRSNLGERMSNAVHMVRVLGMTTVDARKLFMVSESAINMRIRVDALRKNLGEKGIDTSRVPASTMECLGQIDNDDHAFTQLATLVSQHVPSCSRVDTFVKRIKKAKSDGDRGKVVKQIESELAEESREFKNRKKARITAPKAPSRPWRDKFVQSLSKLADFLDFGHDGEGFDRLTTLQVATQVDEKAVRDLWARLELRMSLVLKKGW